MPEEEDGSEDREAALDWKDYIALFIAFVETIALPLVIMIVIVIVLLAVIR